MNKERILFLLAFIVSSLQLNAQSLHAGIEGGVSFNRGSESYGADGSVGFRAGIRVGIPIELPLGKALSINTGFIMQKRASIRHLTP